MTEQNFSRHMVLLRKRKNDFSKLLFHHPPRETCWESQTLIVGGWLMTGSGMRKHVDYCIDLYFTRKYKVCTLSDLDQNKER